MFQDPVVRGLAIFAGVLVILFLVTILSALVMGVLGNTEPKTRAQRDIQYYEMYTKQMPKDTQLWKAYINSLMASKQYLKAQDIIDQATKGVDQKATQDITAAQAELYLAQKKYPEAIKTADIVRKKLKAFYDESKKKPGTDEAKGKEISDNYWNMLIVKSDAQEAMGDKKAAIKSLDEFVKNEPTASDILVKRGLLKADIGDKKGAEKDFRAALKYIPDDPAAKAGLEKIGAKQ